MEKYNANIKNGLKTSRKRGLKLTSLLLVSSCLFLSQPLYAMEEGDESAQERGTPSIRKSSSIEKKPKSTPSSPREDKWKEKEENEDHDEKTPSSYKEKKNEREKLSVEALEELQYRAFHKEPDACYLLGRYIYEGEEEKQESSNPQRYEMALTYLSIAAQQNHEEAMLFMQFIEESDPLTKHRKIKPGEKKEEENASSHTREEESTSNDEAEEIIRAMEQDPELRAKIFNLLQERGMPRDPASIEKDSRIIKSIKNLSKGSQIVSDASYYTVIFTNFTSPILRFFKYENAAEVSQQINSFAKKAGGACKMTKGVCDTITEEQPLYLLNSVAGVSEIMSAHMQESAMECKKKMDDEEKTIKEGKESLENFNKIKCKEDESVKSLIETTKTKIAMSETNLSELSKDMSKYRLGSFILGVGDKVAGKTFDDLSKSKDIKKTLPKTLADNTIGALWDAVTADPVTTWHVGQDVKDGVVTAASAISKTMSGESCVQRK